MATNAFLHEFWNNFTKEQKEHIVSNCYEEYNRFLKGEVTEEDCGIIKRHIQNIIKNINEKFIYSVTNGHLNIVKACLKLGANIHVENDYALRWASAHGHLEVVKYLVEQGAKIHADNEFALTWASGNGYLKVVKYLVEQGANIVKSKAIKFAKKYNHSDIVSYLKSELAKQNKKLP